MTMATEVKIEGTKLIIICDLLKKPTLTGSQKNFSIASVEEQTRFKFNGEDVSGTVKVDLYISKGT